MQYGQSCPVPGFGAWSARSLNSSTLNEPCQTFNKSDTLGMYPDSFLCAKKHFSSQLVGISVHSLPIVAISAFKISDFGAECRSA
jgi:hypothetical protein